jgi:hypothetical protein
MLARCCHPFSVMPFLVMPNLVMSWISSSNYGNRPSSGSGRQLCPTIARWRVWRRRSRQAARTTSLRNAALTSADRRAREVAHRRLSVIRDVLHTLTAPRFGKRGTAPRMPTPEEHYRQMLGLPLGRRLAPTEIHQAYKHAAKTMHPDGGGNEREFRELSAARDALMKER